MTSIKKRPRILRRCIGWGLLAAVAIPVSADWLVTREGTRIETRGPWEVRGRMVVFTHPNGTLSSMRLSEVDLDASHSATEEARRPATVEPPEEPADRPPVLTLTNEDVRRGELGLTGTEALIASIRRAHEYQDVGLIMSLVNFEATPLAYRDFLSREFEWLMNRQIRNIELTEVSPDENLSEVHDGVTYEPNVEVTHRLEIELVPDNEDDRLTLGLLVGQRLDLFFIAAARAVD